MRPRKREAKQSQHNIWDTPQHLPARRLRGNATRMRVGRDGWFQIIVTRRRVKSYRCRRSFVRRAKPRFRKSKKGTPCRLSRPCSPRRRTVRARNSRRSGAVELRECRGRCRPFLSSRICSHCSFSRVLSSAAAPRWNLAFLAFLVPCLSRRSDA